MTDIDGWDSLTEPKKPTSATQTQIESEIEEFKKMLDELNDAWSSQPRPNKENNLSTRRGDLLYLLRQAHHKVEFYADRGE
ncbi:MAG: hypothetical protein KGN01_06760 [Patescibacteria group bacterium]|nr:hypothetical protein [Patescibacteria group bacterium]